MKRLTTRTGPTRTRGKRMRAEAALFMLLLMASSAAGIHVFSEPADGWHPAEELLLLLEPSHDQVEATLERLGEEGLEFPGAWEALLAGEEVAAEAYRLMDLGRLRDAMDAATEALRLYGEALRIALLVEQALAVEADDGSEGLRDELRRTLAFLAKVRSSVDKLGEDVSEVYALLDEASGRLALAEVLLGEGDVEGAEAEVSAAEVLLDRAMELLQGVESDIRAEKAVKFLEKTEERLQEVEEKTTGNEKVLAIALNETTVLGAAFKNAKALPNKIRALIQSGRLEAATDDLDTMKGHVDDADELVEQLLEDKEDREVKVKKDKEDKVKDK